MDLSASVTPIEGKDDTGDMKKRERRMTNHEAIFTILEEKRATDFFHYQWHPSREVKMSTDVFAVLVIGFMSTLVPFLLFRSGATGSTGALLLLFIQVMLGGLIGAAVRKTSPTGRKVKKSLQGLNSNPFVRHDAAKLFGFQHAIVNVTLLVLFFEFPSFTMLGEQPGMDKVHFAAVIHGLVIPYAGLAVHILSSWRTIGRQWTDNGKEEAEEDEKRMFIDPEKVDMEAASKGLMGGVKALGLPAACCIFAFCSAPYFEFISNVNAGEEVQSTTFLQYTLLILPGANAFISFLHNLFLVKGIVVELIRHIAISNDLSIEPLCLEEINHTTLALWWTKRREYVSRTLPVVYFKISIMVVLYFICTIPVLIHVFLRVFSSPDGAMGLLSYFDSRLALSAGVALLIAMLIVIQFEVMVYQATSRTKGTLDTLLIHVLTGHTVNSKYTLRGKVYGEHEVMKRQLLVETLKMMKANTVYDPYATIVGIPVKPTFRNVIYGYFTTAIAVIFSANR